MNNGAIAVTLSLAVFASLISTDTAFSAEDKYKKSQVVSQTNECGNYWFPINVICSNIDSQITGDDNNVAVATPQESENIDSGPPFP